MADLESIFSDTLEELEEFIKEEKISDQHDSDISDRIHEIADGAVPVYTHDLMQLTSDSRVYARDDEGLAGDSADLIQHVQVRVYGAIAEHLHEETEGLIDKLFEECPDCAELFLEDDLHEDDESGDFLCDSCLSDREDEREEDDEEEESFDGLTDKDFEGPEGTEGQDRESYTDDQDRESYTADQD